MAWFWLNNIFPYVLDCLSPPWPWRIIVGKKKQHQRGSSLSTVFSTDCMTERLEKKVSVKWEKSVDILLECNRLSTNVTAINCWLLRNKYGLEISLLQQPYASFVCFESIYHFLHHYHHINSACEQFNVQEIYLINTLNFKDVTCISFERLNRILAYLTIKMKNWTVDMCLSNTSKMTELLRSKIYFSSNLFLPLCR